MWVDALKWTGVANFTVLLMIGLEVFDHSYFMTLLFNIILFYSWGGLKTWDKFL